MLGNFMNQKDFKKSLKMKTKEKFDEKPFNRECKKYITNIQQKES